MRQPWLLPLLFLSFIWTFANSQQASDRAVLLQLYSSLGGSSWILSWDTSTNICTNSLGTVNCDASGKVRKLILPKNLLSGTLPTQIGLLTSLNHLELHSNSITGTIPTELGNLSLLTLLTLNSNQFSGSIPTQLASLSLLTSLFLDNNQLTGSLPSQLASATQFTHFRVNDNLLSGSLPSSWNSNLVQLYLYSNQFSGTIPTGIFRSNLAQIRLNQNSLTGSIPSQISNSSLLFEFFAFNNQLTGSIPTQIGSLTVLQRLWIYLNQLSGSLPTQLGQLTSLRDLRAHSNSLSGSIPTQLANLTSLEVIRLGDNYFTGTIPTQFGSLPLTSLGLQNNSIEGDIPGGILRNTNLASLYLSQTCLGPVEPYSSIPLNDYTSFTVLSTCALSGPFPTGASSPALQYEFYSSTPLNSSGTDNYALTYGGSALGSYSIISFGQWENPRNGALNVTSVNASNANFMFVSSKSLTLTGAYAVEIIFSVPSLTSAAGDIFALGPLIQTAQNVRVKISSSGQLILYKSTTTVVYTSPANTVAINRVNYLLLTSSSSAATLFFNNATLYSGSAISISGSMYLGLVRSCLIAIDEAYVYLTNAVSATARVSTLNWCPTGACATGHTCTPTITGSSCS